MTTTIEQALALAQELEPVSDSPRLDAELLLARALGNTREYLYTWPQQELEDAALRRYRELLGRRRSGEPVAYLTGSKAFWDMDLRVDARVLIPRPETELLVELALELGAGMPGDSLRVADLGCGSGAIAIALARSRPRWRLTAVDVSAEALQLAQSNAREQGTGNIEFQQNSWCDGLGAQEYDMIVANPPYVAPGDPHLAQGSLPHEPVLALVAEEAGMAALRTIAQQAKGSLKKDAWLLLEHGYDQQAALIRLLQAEGYRPIEGHTDHAGVERGVRAQWPG